MKRRRRIGTAARARMRRGGPRATGRPAADTRQWAEIKQEVLSRARKRCEACGERTRLDVHHVVKRAQGGSDFNLDLLVALCRPCHDRTDAPAARGRLVVIPLGSGRFRFELAWNGSDREDVCHAPTPLEAMRIP